MQLPLPRSNVVLKDVAEGAILFCTETETYFSLNPMGVRIWRMLPPVCATETEIVERLLNEHPDVEAATIAADVTELLEELLKHRLVEHQRAA